VIGHGRTIKLNPLAFPFGDQGPGGEQSCRPLFARAMSHRQKIGHADA